MRPAHLAVALLPALLAGPAAAGGGDGEAFSRFRDAFSGGRPAEDRLDAVRGLSTLDRKDAAELLCRAIPDVAAEIEKLSLDRSLVRSKIADLQDGRVPGKGSRDPPSPQDPAEVVTLKLKEDILTRRDREEREVLASLVVALGGFREPRSLAYLCDVALRDGASPALRAAVAEALGRIGDPALAKALRGSLGDRDAGVREAAAVALTRLRGIDPVGDLARALDDPAWTVRLSAARALAARATPEAVDLLLARLSQEAGRLRRDLADLLQGLTRQKFGVEPEGWRDWWSRNRGDYVSGAKRLGDGAVADDSTGPARYYGIATYSKRLVYVIDVSGSMNESGGDSKDTPRVDSAKKELVRSLHTLDGESMFGIVAFNDAVRRWKTGLTKATREAREAASSWVQALAASNSTNTYGALEEAFRTATGNPADVAYGGGADTIFLLTDGSPTTPSGALRGPGGALEADRVLAAVREWNRRKAVVVHAIGAGTGTNREFLAALARENGGRFVEVK